MSDHDMSESSCMESPRSYGAFSTDSPSSSPSQMVPHLTTYLTELSCGDGKQHNAPFLRITEQPQNHFRFRYVSEMIGTHGCLLGKSYPEKKTKTHPTVELVNYSRQARIRCQLSQHNSPEEHPHKLQEDEQDRDVSYVVPEHGSYKVGFAGMGIIHTAKKDVPKLLYMKMADNLKGMSVNQLKTQCESKAKDINLNIVRLKFTAHDLTTGEMICEPVFSEPIHNMKSAATNDLKICRISRLSGRPRGGDDVFILVEKVNKKNIMIRFFELSPNGEEIWTATGNFVQTDVHHQYAIVFRTPPYKNTEISSDTTVYIELVRPSDGRTSEPKEFVYKADTVIRQTKKRRMTSYSSLESTSGGSIKSMSEIPATVELLSQQSENIKYEFETRDYMRHLPTLNQETASPGQCGLANALALAPGLQVLPEQSQVCPMWNQATGPTNSSIPNLTLNSLEFEKVLKLDTDIPPEERKMLSEGWWLSEYINSYGDSLPGEVPIDFKRGPLVADSGRSKGKTLQTRTPKHTEETRPEAKITNENGDYLPVYKVEDAVEVKKLVKELCDIIRVKKGYNKEEVQNTLERLFDIRLTNGDRFLHMALFTKQPSFDYIVKMIHGVRMTHLFDLGNDRQQTILHMAIMNDRPNVVTLLISKGCSPMAKDCDDDNAIHYAVRTQSCLVPLLDAIKKYKVPCDLNQSNNEKQSPLHLAAMYNCAASARALLQHGASYSVRDTHGRTPLHLAAYDDKLLCARALLDFIAPIDIDIEDGRGNTALQIVCGGTMGKNTLEFVRLLLEKKADPLRRAEGGECAWRLARGRPALRDALAQVLPHLVDVKSEPEDDFHSADEGGEEQEEVRGRQRLREQGWARAAAAQLDRGGWHALARRLAPSLLPLLPDRPSPTLALLDALEAQDGFTAETLATALEDVGQPAIAQQIRRYIE